MTGNNKHHAMVRAPGGAAVRSIPRDPAPPRLDLNTITRKSIVANGVHTRSTWSGGSPRSVGSMKDPIP